MYIEAFITHFGELSDTRQSKKVTLTRSENPDYVYLFQSYRNRWSLNKDPKPLSRRDVSRAIASIGEEVGLALGTHSMRKTRGYHLYKNTRDIARVMKMLRHGPEAVTLRYIGITKDDVDRDLRSWSFDDNKRAEGHAYFCVLGIDINLISNRYLNNVCNR